MTTEIPPSASPSLADGMSVTVTRVYAEAEQAILMRFTLDVRAALEQADPATALMARSYGQQRAVNAILDRMEARARTAVPQVLADAYGRGHRAERRIVDTAVRGLLERLATLRWGILRWLSDLTNRVVAALATSKDARAAADRILQPAAGRGIVGYVDPRGRRWSLTGYVDQAVQHAAGNASIDGFLVRVTDDGGDLVIVTQSAHPCPLCIPWEHRVLSITGHASRRPSMATAREAGLFHPNCHHTIARWAPGFQWAPHSIEHEPGTYEAVQRQRDIERHIREWKRRQAAALDDITRAKAGRKVRSWEAELKLHLAAEGLKRSRQRERTDYGHTRPLTHAHGGR